MEIGIDSHMDEFLDRLEKNAPPLASIDEILVEDEPVKGYSDFVILESHEGAKLSPIPVDTATCDRCIRDISDKDGRRYLYPFTNCTDCGARFSVIGDVPYDRDKTSMEDFEMCSDCYEEYAGISDRRFHAQTLSCTACGPEYMLYDSEQRILVQGDSTGAIKKFAETIDSGAIGVVKSWGGMHLVCNLDKIQGMREWYHRERKPFAVMLRDLETIQKYAHVSEEESKLLLSPQRPIVLLRKKESTSAVNEILENISPGLGNIGCYTPYTAMHHILFHFYPGDGMIMTSTNLHGEPMITKNEDAFNMGVDCYLLHNRHIINRNDDSVIRVYKDNHFFLRKSRGYTPLRLDVPYDGNIVGVGAEENVASCISKNKRLYASQYIGNTKYYETLQFLRSGTMYLMNLLDVKNMDAVAIDLHPTYHSRRFGEELADEYNCELVEVQHHWAHAASLMLDNVVFDEPIIALTLDGAGYGSDATIWGGEVLSCSFDGFEHVATLEKIPLLGGDMAVKDPRRLVFAIFEKLGLETEHFDEPTVNVFRKLMDKSPLSSGFGRVLDALSCYLDICCTRTYDGEPAMRLEKYLDRGSLRHELNVDAAGSNPATVETFALFEQIKDLPKDTEQDIADISYSFVHCLLQELTNIAINTALDRGIRYVGVTGGVSYNIPITRMVESFVEDSGLQLLLHHRVPNGDGGISFGQNIIAGMSS